MKLQNTHYQFMKNIRLEYQTNFYYYETGFPTDLIRYQLDFLKNIDVRGELFYEESFIRNAIRRYENLWIPLVHTLISQDNSVDEFDLAPPLGKKIFVSDPTIHLCMILNSF